MTQNKVAKFPKSSKKARATAARLASVQVVYQIMTSGRSGKTILKDYLDHYAGMEIEGLRMVTPDGAMVEEIALGVEARLPDLRAMVAARLAPPPENQPEKKLEPLLHTILLCGAYELLAHHDIDAPIIIADYLHVAHAFYGKDEAGLVNGILDALRKILRPDQA